MDRRRDPSWAPRQEAGRYDRRERDELIRAQRHVDVPKKRQFNEYDSYDGFAHHDDYSEYANGGYSDEQDEEDHWRHQQHHGHHRVQQQQQQPNDVYDSVPPTRNVARIQVSAVEPLLQQELHHQSQNVPQAPPPPRFDDFSPSHEKMSKYGPGGQRKEERRESIDVRPEPKKTERTGEVHIRYDPHATMHTYKQAFIDGFSSGHQDEKPAKKKESSPTAGAIRAIINNFKGGGDKHDDSSRSTNPFMRGVVAANHHQHHPQHQEKSSSTAKVHEPLAPKNVQEVVQKMNNGDWPIRIDDDDERTSGVADIRDRDREIRRMPPMEKARQWETLHRKKEERRASAQEMEKLRLADPKPAGNQRHQAVPSEGKDLRKEDVDKFSERSEEHTSVSTDSALCSDTPAFLPVYKCPMDFVKPLDAPGGDVKLEADKLLLYIKSHRSVLNYLGIGLCEPLWKHIESLPAYPSAILIGNTNEHSNSQKCTEITVNGVHQAHAKATTGREDVRSPHRTAQLLEELKTDGAKPRQSLQNLQKLPPPTTQQRKLVDVYETDSVRTSSVASKDNRAGRFVKKSAAALIAKKQGVVPVGNEDSPNSAEIIDPRIAAEIRSLKEREEELKLSRSQLGLPTIDDVIETWQGRRSVLRSAQSFDHLNRIDVQTPNGPNSPLERSHSTHNVFIEDSLAREHRADDGYYSYAQEKMALPPTSYGSEPRARRDASNVTRAAHPHRLLAATNAHDFARDRQRGDFFRGRQETAAFAETSRGHPLAKSGSTLDASAAHRQAHVVATRVDVNVVASPRAASRTGPNGTGMARKAASSPYKAGF